MRTLGFCSLAMVLFVVFAILRVAFIYLVLAVVISIAQWQVDNRIVLAVSIGLALLIPSGSVSTSSTSSTRRGY